MRFLFGAAAATLALAASTVVTPAWAGSHDAIPSRQDIAGVGAAEMSPLQPLAGSIYALGSSRYTSAFAGVQISAGKLDVYAVRRQDRGFLAALATLDILQGTRTSVRLISILKSRATASEEYLPQPIVAYTRQASNTIPVLPTPVTVTAIILSVR